MKSIKLLAVLLVIITTSCAAQTNNLKTKTVKINGNCGMCKSTIETAGNSKKESNVVWNKDTKLAIISFDSIKTNESEILKRIALAGYDNESFFAPDDTYASLPGCCQYERTNKTVAIIEQPAEKMVLDENISKNENIEIAQTETKMDMNMDIKDVQEVKEANTQEHIDHSTTSNTVVKTATTIVTPPKVQPFSQLKKVYDAYFLLKDALVNTDGETASKAASKLLEAVNSINMNQLEMDVHMVWMKVLNDLKTDAQKIIATKDSKSQREYFDTLSDNLYKLMKVSPTNDPVYYQHCLMANDGAGANWLSKDSIIKNPYYGSQMLSCGKTVETIK